MCTQEQASGSRKERNRKVLYDEGKSFLEYLHKSILHLCFLCRYHILHFTTFISHSFLLLEVQGVGMHEEFIQIFLKANLKARAVLVSNIHTEHVSSLSR